MLCLGQCHESEWMCAVNSKHIGGTVLILLALAGGFWWFDEPDPDSARVAAESLSNSEGVADVPKDHGRATAKPDADHRGAGRPAPKVADDGTAPVPARYRIAGIERVQTASSFEDWMSRFTAQDQEILRAFSKRNYGVYRVHSRETVAWMAQHGYPMPEEVLAAQSMSRATLRSMAKRGNLKAAFLLRSRNIQERARGIEDYLAKGKTLADFYRDHPQYITDEDLVRTLAGQSHSPYKAFLAADKARLGDDPDASDAEVVAALMWAGLLGDFRNQRLVQRFVFSDPSRVQVRKAYALASASTSNLYLRSIVENCPGQIGVSSTGNPTFHFYLNP